FFQGTLGQFTAYSALGQLDRASQDGSGGRSRTSEAPERETSNPKVNVGNRVSTTHTELPANQEVPTKNRGLAKQ
ncbi:hypothetical protein LN543_21650, partial [Xanthomonas hortorum pv. gardneri]|nr:hypothetical protein [Xanthomonas hortorum pv. gardneri]